MTADQIAQVSDRQLTDRLAFLRHETTAGRAHYGTATLRQLTAEREAIVAELDWRRTEATWERWHGMSAQIGQLATTMEAAQ